MMKIGLHCNYWNGAAAEMEPYELLRLHLASGAEAMDFPTAIALRLSPAQRREYGATAAREGVVLSMNGGCAGADISHPDAEARAVGLDACRQAIEAAAELGCRVWSGVIYAPWLGMPEDTLTAGRKAARWARAVESLRTLCDFALPLGVDICIEIVNRFEAFMINTAADGVRFAEDVDRPNLKLLLDAFHMNIEEDRSADAIWKTAAAGRLGHIHISESNRRLPGLRETDMDWKGILSALRRSGYDGSVILESMVLSGTPAAYSFRVWRDIADSTSIDALIADARQSLGFVRNLLRG